LNTKQLKISKRYAIGKKRFVLVKKEAGELTVTIGEDGFDLKSISFTPQRWARFIEIMGLIDETVNSLLAKQNVGFCAHIGGGWFVSLTTGYLCVDLRKFYLHPTLGPRPSRTEVALRLAEFTTFHEVVR
jgi:hypothetical protein